MVTYIIRRLLQGVVVVFIITFFAFAIVSSRPSAVESAAARPPAATKPETT